MAFEQPLGDYRHINMTDCRAQIVYLLVIKIEIRDGMNEVQLRPC